MAKRNQTLLTEFLLLGFGDLQDFKILIFTIFLIIHLMALISNGLICIIVMFIRSLHSPMYIFISQLSLSEIMFTSNIVPNMLWLILEGTGKVSISRCIFQLFLLAFAVVAQCLLLGSMSFDRYVAICQPLRYTSIMTFGQLVKMVTLCWLLGFTSSFVLYIFMGSLQFCGADTINHFYCDVFPVVELSCSENLSVELITFVMCFIFALCPFVFIMATYISILRTILNIPSTTGRQKAYSTCSSHLTVVCLYYGSLGSIYIFPPNKNSFNTNKVLSLLYTLVTPLVNPLIYSLRNQEIRHVISKFIQL